MLRRVGREAERRLAALDKEPSSSKLEEEGGGPFGATAAAAPLSDDPSASQILVFLLNYRATLSFVEGPPREQFSDSPWQFLLRLVACGSPDLAAASACFVVVRPAGASVWGSENKLPVKTLGDLGVKVSTWLLDRQRQRVFPANPRIYLPTLTEAGEDEEPEMWGSCGGVGRMVSTSGTRTANGSPSPPASISEEHSDCLSTCPSSEPHSSECHGEATALAEREEVVLDIESDEKGGGGGRKDSLGKRPDEVDGAWKPRGWGSSGAGGPLSFAAFAAAALAGGAARSGSGAPENDGAKSCIANSSV